MKINNIKKTGAESYRIEYRTFFGTKTRDCFIGESKHCVCKWRDSGEWVGDNIDGIMLWMKRNNVKSFDEFG